MRYLSLLRDSVRESLDRRFFLITLVFCSLIILACASIGFEPIPIDKTINKRLSRYHMLSLKATEVRPAEGEFAGGWTFRFDAGPPVEIQKQALILRAWSSSPNKEAVDWKTAAIPGLSPDRTTILDPPSDEDLIRYAERLINLGVGTLRTSLESRSETSIVYRVRYRPKSQDLMTFGHRVNVFFGAWKIDQDYTDVKESVFFIQKLLAGVIVSWAGVLAGIVLTAGFVPNMLQKGMIDLVLSRPVRRWKVLLLKYVGGLTYVLATASFLIVGCWMALALRSGIGSPGFLLCIPLLVFFFAAIHAVSVFIGVTKRNVTEAIMVSIVAWVSLTSLGFIHFEMNRPGGGLDLGSGTRKVVNAMHAVTPPLGEVGTAVSWVLLRANDITPERFARNPMRSPRDRYPEVDWARLFGVTGAWMALLLTAACWTFSRRDY